MLGGSLGADVLQGILELPRRSALGESAYPTIFDKAAVLLRSIALDHPFVDGNKRMALATAMVFLSINGWLLRATDDELRDFTLEIVTGRVRQLFQIGEWLELKSVAIDEGNT
jgi:death on curing protein